MDWETYFVKYGEAHQNKWNRICHSVGIPFIVISLVLLIFKETRVIGWIFFAVGWVFQLLGHAIERTRPEFLNHPIYLLIGPLYFVRKIRGKSK